MNLLTPACLHLPRNIQFTGFYISFLTGTLFFLLSFHFLVSPRLRVLIEIVSFPSVCFVECFECLESFRFTERQMDTASVPDATPTHAALAARTPLSPVQPLASAPPAGSGLCESGTGGRSGPSPRTDPR